MEDEVIDDNPKTLTTYHSFGCVQGGAGTADDANVANEARDELELHPQAFLSTLNNCNG